MITIYPEFYNRFICKADKCEHTCCAGWEIDIDEQTQEYYRNLEGDIGDELRASMKESDGTVSFELENGRCPFLNEKNLCLIILSEGEDSLCDICALHPRFYEDISDEYELFGVGLSCEKTCELLAQEKDTIEYCVGNDNVRMDISWVLDIAGYEVDEKWLEFTPSMDKNAVLDIIFEYRKTEAIDENWIKELDDLEEFIRNDKAGLDKYKAVYDRNLYNNIKQYIIYRQIEYMEDYGTKCICGYAQMATQFIFMESAMDENVQEHLRRWSEQIEYSTINVEQLLNITKEEK